MLVGIHADHRSTRDNRDIPLDSCGSGSEIVGSGFNNQACLAVFDLGSAFGADGKIQVVIGHGTLPAKTARWFGHFRSLVLLAILFDEYGNFAYSVGVGHTNNDRRGLSNRVQRWRQT